MKHNRHTLPNKRPVVLTLAVILVLAGVALFALAWRQRTEASPEPIPTSQPAPLFTFNAAAAPGWRKGPGNETSLALFHNDTSTNCFVYAAIEPGKADIAKALQEKTAMMAKSGHTETPLSTQTLTLQTASGPQPYELHQSHVTTPAGREKLLGGQELGHIPLGDKHIEIVGNCLTPEDLPATIPAIQAIEYNEHS